MSASNKHPAEPVPVSSYSGISKNLKDLEQVLGSGGVSLAREPQDRLRGGANGVGGRVRSHPLGPVGSVNS